jgi:glycosyltransferase involved in cell wall biosynthesis
MLLFSVIIPVYNRAHLITGPICSVLSQTYTEFEIIIVDDGSTDNLEELIVSNFSNEKRIRYFKIENGERGAARNFGLKQAKGDFATFFDSDDIMKPYYLETLYNIIKEYPGIKLLAAKYNYDNNGKIKDKPVLNDLDEGWYDQSLFLKGSVLACNYCVRIKENDFKLFPTERELASMEDWLFLLTNLASNKIFIKDRICLTMRHHDERSMSNNQKVIEARKKATNWILNKLELSPTSKKTLIAWSHYFCGVHEYLDNKKSAAMKEAVTAIKADGLQKKFLLLLAKSIVGRKLIKAIR